MEKFEEIETIFEQLENEIIEMWRHLKGYDAMYHSTKEKLTYINKLYEWNSGDWIPQEHEDPESTYSVEVLALYDNGLGGQYHEIVQYNYKDKTWCDEHGTQKRAPLRWQYIYDKSDEKDDEQ